MLKRIYLVIIWSITILCIGFGCVRYDNGRGYLLFSFSGTKAYEEVNDFSDKIERTTENKTGEKGTHVYEQPFTNLVIDCDVADVTIKRGNTLSCDYRIARDTKYAFDWKPENEGTAYITLENQKKSNNRGSSFIIYIPSDVKLSNLTVENAVGDTLVKEVSIDTVSVTDDVGDVELEQVTSKDITMDSDTGDVDVSDVVFQNLSATLGVGDCTLEDVNVDDYNLDLRSGVGDIDINSDSYRSKCIIENGLSQSITISSSVGDIEIEK